MARRKIRSIAQRTSTTGSLNLCNERLKKGVSLEHIAEVTKISMRFLRAIEEEEFDKLPGGIFNTSYLRQYAAAIGLDESCLLSYYNRLMHPETTDGPVAPPVERSFFDRWFRVPAPVQRS